jgi:hypothetical protein
MPKKKLRMWKVGCHTYGCKRRPARLVRDDEGNCVPKCYQHSRDPNYEVVAKVEWTAAAKGMRLSQELPDPAR